jgi:hypothetical protein
MTAVIGNAEVQGHGQTPRPRPATRARRAQDQEEGQKRSHLGAASARKSSTRSG